MSNVLEAKQIWESSDSKGYITVEPLCNAGIKVTGMYAGKRIQDSCSWPRTDTECRVTDMIGHACLYPVSGNLDRVVNELIKRAKRLIEEKIAQNSAQVKQQIVFERQQSSLLKKLQ